MTTSQHAGQAHLDDADIVRLLDGEPSPGERSRMDAHIATCDQCAAAIASLLVDAATVRGWLQRAAFEEALPDAGPPGYADAGAVADVDVDVDANAAVGAHAAVPRQPPAPPGPVAPGAPPRRTARPPRRTAVPAWLLRAAAIIVVVAAPVAAIPTLRDAVIAAIPGTGGDAPAGSAAFRAAPAAPAAPAAAHAGVIRFEPAAGEFVVRIEAAQAVGTLRIVRADGPEAVLRLSDGSVGAVVAAAAVHIHNTPGDVGGYTLDVPATVTRVLVFVAGTRTAVVTGGDLAAGRELPVR
jgi:hypothetical protein